jgi:glycosyltransferase involved in cell wall biosynthesis
MAIIEQGPSPVEPHSWTPPRTLDGLSIVLPCHNEADNVAAAVAEARTAAAAVAERFEVIVVDDGSTDATWAIACALVAEHPDVRLISRGTNGGYGAAIRTGIDAAVMPWVFLTDADLQFDLAQIEDLLPHAGEHDVVVGYRVTRMDPLGRRIDAALWNRLVRLVFGLQVRDVDCAFKLIPRTLLDRFTLRSDGAMIDTELLLLCLRAGATIHEVPVRHRPRLAGEQSGANWRVVARAFRELGVLRQRLTAGPTAG